MHSTNQPYKTIVGMLFGLTILYLVKGYQIFLVIVTILGFLSLISDKLVLFVDTLMQRTVSLLGKFLSTTILILMYYLILSPLALISKLFGKKNALVMHKPNKSNFVEVEKVFTKESFNKLW